jgi:two-component system, NtrC family, sensor histidine kinase HydH
VKEKPLPAAKNGKFKTILIAVLIIINTLFLYSTEVSEKHYLVFYLSFYFVPVILAGFWFGLRSALASSLGITLLYLPFTVMHWKGFSADDLNNMMEMILFNAVAVIFGVLRDREQAEQKRSREAENLAAIGRAMTSVAHDMKTPLIAIGGFSRLVQGKLQKYSSKNEDYKTLAEEAQEKLDIVINETRRLENMVKDMLDFAKPMELHRSEEDVKGIIEECLSVIRDLAQEKRLNLHTQSSENLPPVSLDAMRMKRVLINLVMNAIQASPEGGTITVHSYQRGNKVIIEVIDCGCGVPSDKREEIFWPFYSTKKEGTGLGLPIAKRIVEAHRGRLEVLENKEKGAIFRILIPVNESGPGKTR